MPEPRRDAFWAARGEDLEDLAGVGGAQPWEHSGIATTRTGLSLLLDAWRKRIRAAKLDVPEREAFADLVGGGLLTDDGALTEAGLRFTEVVRRADRHVRVEAAASLAPLTLDAYWVGSAAVVVLTDPPAWWAGPRRSGEEIAAMAGRVWLQDVPTSYLPVLVAAWLGLGPAWPMATEPELLPFASVVARADDPDTPVPDGGDEALREVWSQPWWLWTLQTSDDTGLIGVSAGTRGVFGLQRPAGDEERVRFQAWPAESVWAAVVAAVIG
ncbi:hypothetical protein [Nocardioides sp. CER19]|uniref:hypothetical protein n=1 Tax=Nocardioides sp. CER19 TaxID=3038538 RepID=UPI00244BBF94|nr:hypothetical protein [Nocardioides sp. CER19]MDH2412723.1 hypothetical protein [Nocardioides sp. CER19]